VDSAGPARRAHKADRSRALRALSGGRPDSCINGQHVGWEPPAAGEAARAIWTTVEAIPICKSASKRFQNDSPGPGAQSALGIRVGVKGFSRRRRCEHSEHLWLLCRNGKLEIGPGRAPGHSPPSGGTAESVEQAAPTPTVRARVAPMPRAVNLTHLAVQRVNSGRLRVAFRRIVFCSWWRERSIHDL
jgi:hypothetical protein